MVLNGSRLIGNNSKVSGLDYKMDEDQHGLITDFVANLLNFSMPSHTHDSDNHRNCYGHRKTATRGV
jgi:hypothetical protein